MKPVYMYNFLVPHRLMITGECVFTTPMAVDNEVEDETQPEAGAATASQKGCERSRSPEGGEKQKPSKKRRPEEESRSPSWCKVCGGSLSAAPHRELRECRMADHEACHFCGRKGHKVAAHYVTDGMAKAFMKSVHGHDFVLRSPVFKRKDRRERVE